MRAPWFAPPFGGAAAHQSAPRRLRGDGRGAEGRAAAARLSAARPVRHRHRFPRLSREAAAQLAARGDRDRASADPRLPGSGRRRARPSPTRPSSPSPPARPRASRAPSRPSRSASSTSASTARGRAWPGRAAFLARALPAARRALGEAEEAVLIDGSVLANAPFGPAVAALEKRPSRREVDRRFVYIDPKPGMKSVRLTARGETTSRPASSPPSSARCPTSRASSRSATISRRSSGCRRGSGGCGGSSRSMRPEVEAAIERAVGSSFFLDRPNAEAARRLAGQGPRSRRRARPAMPMPPTASSRSPRWSRRWPRRIFRLGGGGDRARRRQVRRRDLAARPRRSAWPTRTRSPPGARGADVVHFLVAFDLTFRTRRLRFVARRLTEMAATDGGAARGGRRRCSAHAPRP